MLNHPHRPRRLSISMLLIGLALIGIVGLSSQSRAANNPGEGPIDLALYGRLLEEHTRVVDDLAGVRVDYRSLTASPNWKRLTRQVHAANPDGLARDAKLAFWINAYNILTIDLVVQHYPITGIKKIGSFFSPVWNIKVATIAGRSVSLGDIEHEILRKMDEPFIHGAIVCASASCPPLARQPFRPDHLREDLAAAMKTWLAHREKGIAIDRAKKVIRLSKVFDWFEADFDSRGGVLEAIADVLSPEDASWIRSEGRDASIRYFGYDWSLNDLK
jgi:hypothetical protein